MFGVASAILGGVQLAGGLIAAASLGDRPAYSEDPSFTQSAARAETMAKSGYTPQERAAFQGRLATGQATDFTRAMDVGGGNLAQSLLGAMTSRATNAENQFAASDAALRRQNIQYADSFSRERQQRRDAQTQLDTQYRMSEEQAIGGAIQSGLTGLAGAFNFNQAMGSYMDALNFDETKITDNSMKGIQQSTQATPQVAAFGSVPGAPTVNQQQGYFSPANQYGAGYTPGFNYPFGGIPGLSVPGLGSFMPNIFPE